MKNCDLFLLTLFKFLIVNKHLCKLNGESAMRELNFVNFFSTYDKAKLIHTKIINQVFEIVLERNEKLITAGFFGFRDRLKIFMSDFKKHSPIFESYVNTRLKYDSNEIYNMKQSDIESFVTLTSAKRIGHSGISLKDKELVMWRFDEFTTIVGRFSPMNRTVEPWKKICNLVLLN